MLETVSIQRLKITAALFDELFGVLFLFLKSSLDEKVNKGRIPFQNSISFFKSCISANIPLAPTFNHSHYALNTWCARAGLDNTLFELNLSSMEWQAISGAALRPDPRAYFGFSWCLDALYVHSGIGERGANRNGGNRYPTILFLIRSCI